MPRKSKKSQVASQRWQGLHDIDRVKADGVPQSIGEVKKSEVCDAEKQRGESASCQPQVSYTDMPKRRCVSESPAAGPSNTKQVNRRGETNDPGVQQVTYADMVKRKLASVSRTAGPSNSGQINYVAQTDKPCSTQVSYPDTVKKGNHSNYQSVSGSSRVRNVNSVNQSGEKNVCASRSQASLKYGRSRNQQCTCNSLTFLAFLYESEHITRADLDRVLDKGDAMYREIRKTVDHAHLTTDELPDQVPARRHVQTVDKLQLSRYVGSCTYELKPVVFCDVNPSDAIPATESPSTSPSVTTTVINDDTSAPQMNTDVHENTECDMETEPEPLIDFSQCSVTLTGPEILTPEMNTTLPYSDRPLSVKLIVKRNRERYEKNSEEIDSALEDFEQNRGVVDEWCNLAPESELVRMALRTLLETRPASPYTRLPPLHVVFLKIEDTPKVVSWSFEGPSASPTCIKQNKTAIISDGQSITKITLFEAVAGKVVEGGAYYMRGHTLMGKSPPFSINVGSGTQFYQGSKIACPPELMLRAEALLHPASPPVALHQCREQQGLMSLEGVVVELSAVKRVESAREAVPLRKLVLQQEKSFVKVSLWREAALEPLAVGETISISHLKTQRSDYGLVVNSTGFTKIETQQTSQHLEIVGVLKEEGATSSSGPHEESYEVLLESGETLQIAKALWDPSFDEAIQEGALKVTATVKGKNISKMSIL
ncbi:hypothetical protein KUCAC02_037001 [Xyrichtys novacula]|uniref:Peptidase C76 domain-containing protein n=1 Tax=Xyrichtys novacula TaxID=13765 RepID=A0AAV1F9V0_XYRNO|nr:hypothetical protein KUCAC02_037001 [Xyrichtys novacula]